VKPPLVPGNVTTVAEDAEAALSARTDGPDQEATQTVIASTVSSAVAVSISASLMASTGAAVAASVAASVVSATGGAAAGSTASGVAGGAAAGGGGGAAISSAMPLLLGAQRFSISSGLAVNGSGMHSAVADSMNWASGDFGFIRSSSRSRRQLADVDPEAAAPVSKTAKTFASLINVYATMAATLLFVFVLYFLVQYYWRHHANRKFYIEQGRFSIKKKKIRFVPFPSLFVFPGLAVVGMSIFITAITSKSTALLMSDDGFACGSGCRSLAWVGLGIVATYQAFGCIMIYRFNTSFRASAWKPAAPVDSPDKVVDPLYRLLSKMRAKLGGKFSHMDRTRGKFAKPKEDVKEPGRTERILAHPWSISKRRASDSLDAYGFALMARAGGFTWHATSFEFTILGVQTLVGVANGIGSTLEPGSNAAVAQISLVLALQAVHSIWVFVSKPSVDRIMNMLVGTQFALEACQTAMLLLVVYYPPAPILQTSSLILALASVAAPVLQRFYDAVIVQLVKIFVQGGFNPKAAFFAMLGLLVFLPSMIFKILGIDTGGKDGLAKNAGDDLNKLSAKTANEALVGEIESNAEEIIANAFWAAEKRHGERRETSAILIQRRFRQRKARQAREAKQKGKGSMRRAPKLFKQKKTSAKADGSMEESSTRSITEQSTSSIGEPSMMSFEELSISTSHEITKGVGWQSSRLEVYREESATSTPKSCNSKAHSPRVNPRPPLGGAVIHVDADGNLEVKARSTIRASRGSPRPSPMGQDTARDGERPGAQWLRNQLAAIDGDVSFTRTLSLNKEASIEAQARDTQIRARAIREATGKRVAPGPPPRASEHPFQQPSSVFGLPAYEITPLPRAVSTEDWPSHRQHSELNRIVSASTLPSYPGIAGGSFDCSASPESRKREKEARQRANMARKRAADSLAAAWQV
jgi:hypothetical protein